MEPQAGAGDPRPLPSARAITRALRPLRRAGVDTAGLGKRTFYRTIISVDLEAPPRRYPESDLESFLDRLLGVPGRQRLPSEPNPVHTAPAGIRDRLPVLSSFRRAGTETPVWEFVLRLMELWRRADPAGFARALAQLRAGRLWVDFRPARPPGRLLASSGHMTRGPDASRMTSALVVRGEP